MALARLSLLPLLCALQGLAQPPEVKPFGGDTHAYWLEVCARCHGANGNGRNDAGAQLPDAGFDFTEGRKANHKRDQDWIRITLEGKDKMPAFKGKMTEAQVKQMIDEVLRPFAAKH